MKQLAIIAVALLVTALIGGVAGWTMAKRSSDRGIIAQQKKDAKSVLEIAKKEKARVRYVERIKTVIREIPTDDCIDTALNPDFISRVRSGFGN